MLKNLECWRTILITISRDFALACGIDDTHTSRHNTHDSDMSGSWRENQKGLHPASVQFQKRRWEQENTEHRRLSFTPIIRQYYSCFGILWASDSLHVPPYTTRFKLQILHCEWPAPRQVWNIECVPCYKSAFICIIFKRLLDDQLMHNIWYYIILFNRLEAILKI